MQINPICMAILFRNCFAKTEKAFLQPKLKKRYTNLTYKFSSEIWHSKETINPDHLFRKSPSVWLRRIIFWKEVLVKC